LPVASTDAAIPHIVTNGWALGSHGNPPPARDVY